MKTRDKMQPNQHPTKGNTHWFAETSFVSGSLLFVSVVLNPLQAYSELVKKTQSRNRCFSPTEGILHVKI